jgi:hypothetical protein
MNFTKLKNIVYWWWLHSCDNGTIQDSIFILVRWCQEMTGGYYPCFKLLSRIDLLSHSQFRWFVRFFCLSFCWETFSSLKSTLVELIIDHKGDKQVVNDFFWLLWSTSSSSMIWSMTNIDFNFRLLYHLTIIRFFWWRQILQVVQSRWIDSDPNKC